MPAQDRGDRYGPEYQRARREWAPLVASGLVYCSRQGADPQCHGLIGPGEPWDLDHIDGTLKPAHRACNRRAGAVNRNRLHAKHRPTREW